MRWGLVLFLDADHQGAGHRARTAAIVNSVLIESRQASSSTSIYMQKNVVGRKNTWEIIVEDKEDPHRNNGHDHNDGVADDFLWQI